MKNVLLGVSLTLNVVLLVLTFAVVDYTAKVVETSNLALVEDSTGDR